MYYLAYDVFLMFRLEISPTVLPNNFVCQWRT